MSEPKLLMLGALDTCEPRVFELAADELDALADSAALRELETRGAAGGDLLPDAAKPIE